MQAFLIKINISQQLNDTARWTKGSIDGVHGLPVYLINIINIWPFKHSETVPVIKGYRNKIELNMHL